MNDQHDLQDHTFLIVDDEETMRDLAGDIVASTKGKSLYASNGKEAIEVFKNHSDLISVVLLDVIMPKMDGVKAFEEIRKIKDDVRVIFLSGYAEPNTIAKLRRQTGVGFMQKPYTPKNLIKKIQAQL